MNQLITITQNENKDQVVSGRELHEFLGVKDHYTDWFKDMCKYGFTENFDFITLNELSEKTEGSRLVKRNIINHALKIDMAKEISISSSYFRNTLVNATTNIVILASTKRCIFFKV